MRIGIDIMGGDFAPVATSIGAILARKELPSSVELALIGNEDLINKHIIEAGGNLNDFIIYPTTEVIGMGEHPAKAFQQKPNSSISKGFRLLASGEISGFSSAGNTGAMLVGAMYTVKSIPGVIRPTIAATIPTLSGKYIVMADVGINVDCKPDVLYQYGILASLYAESLYGIENPRVGLLNIGGEEEKGNLLTRSVHELMKDSSDFKFVGNVEGNQILSDDKCDIIVTDGFAGNVLLKSMEAIYSLVKKRNIQDEFFDKFNFENYGGTPVLGINSIVLIGHGVSNEIAIKNMIIHTNLMCQSNLVEKIKEAFK